MDVKSIDDVFWLVGGDFNVISSIDEQSNDVLSRSGAIKEFNDVLMLSGLLDLGFVGDRLTWTNKRIWKRLDRNLIFPSWNVKDLVIKLRRLKEYMKWWNKDAFGNIHDKVKLEEERYAEAERKFDVDPSVENTVQMAESQASLIWEGGSCLEKAELIQASGVSFFENLLANGVEVLHNDGMEHIPALIDTDENIALSNNPTIKEVKQVVWEMHEDGVAGLDGFSVAFYKECWETIKEDVLEAVLDFFNGGTFPRGMAATTLVLIPKCNNAQQWKDFRPISSCNVSNKIVSKLVANRLNSVIHKLISPSQSGFVKGRLISDNIHLAQELNHKLNYRVRGGNLILKLDMAKAYDRVQWVFLLNVMKAFGFSDRFMDIIKRCIANC
ncbi:hypothetical protein ZIOFF_056576 [Zingiber officinale]|uniref:Reverse transcriptase domain-containing protein n=1 Tax=Zingiber officinale TaxID=94328 RepID=A0A8J5FJ35_ZINOF|nr:hypothetical protein ZIOFF_056576 [Zingiber officinale]